MRSYANIWIRDAVNYYSIILLYYRIIIIKQSTFVLTCKIRVPKASALLLPEVPRFPYRKPAKMRDFDWDSRPGIRGICLNPSSLPARH